MHTRAWEEIEGALNRLEARRGHSRYAVAVVKEHLARLKSGDRPAPSGEKQAAE